MMMMMTAETEQTVSSDNSREVYRWVLVQRAGAAVEPNLGWKTGRTKHTEVVAKAEMLMLDADGLVS